MNGLFSRETIKFLVENRYQNSKEWFEEHKKEYNQFVIAPLISLAEKLTPTLLDIDDKLICSPKVGGAVSRIWRDARYSKDKSLFRDMMWCMFIREKGNGLPEFFFVISPDDILYGSGYYSAGAASMESVRNLITARDNVFLSALSAYENQNTFLLEGDMYKRSRYPDAPENLRSWLDRKTLCFLRRSCDFDLLYSGELAEIVADGYRTLAPIYNFLIKAEEKIEK